MSRDEGYLLDMLMACRLAVKFSRGSTREGFRQDEMVQAAVMREVQIIGEAARGISTDFKKAHPETPWEKIVGMRHRLVHDYFRIIPDRVWDVVEKDLPTLIKQLEPLVPPDEGAT